MAAYVIKKGHEGPNGEWEPEYRKKPGNLFMASFDDQGLLVEKKLISAMRLKFRKHVSWMLWIIWWGGKSLSIEYIEYPTKPGLEVAMSVVQKISVPEFAWRLCPV